MVILKMQYKSDASNVIRECRRHLRGMDKRLMEVQGHIRIKDLENVKFRNQHELLQKLERLRLLILGHDSIAFSICRSSIVGVACPNINERILSAFLRIAS